MADWDMVNTDVVEWIQEHDFDLTYAGIEITSDQNDQLRKELVNFGGVQRYNMGQLTKALEAGFADNAAIIARTELTRAYAEGNLAAWEASGVTEGKEWDKANDILVCELCRVLQDQVVPIDQLFLGRYNGPPAHEGCYCSISPIVRGDDRTAAEIRKEYGWTVAWEDKPVEG